jgi:hypothetical protein
MSSKRGWFWVAGTVAAASVITVGGCVGVRDPLLIPGSHGVSVYALAQAPEVVEQGPDPLGRLIGMCDFDSYYAVDGDRKMCLVLGGPLGGVRASRNGGRVTVAASDVDRLRAMAAKGQASTLVLMGGKPDALIPVTGLTPGKPVSVPALS